MIDPRFKPGDPVKASHMKWLADQIKRKTVIAKGNLAASETPDGTTLRFLGDNLVYVKITSNNTVSGNYYAEMLTPDGNGGLQLPIVCRAKPLST